MSSAIKGRQSSVIGPFGERMTMHDLPHAKNDRWIARRKAEVVAAIEGGLLTVAGACARYELSLEELSSWQRDYRKYGLKGLQQAAGRHHSLEKVRRRH